MSKRRQELLSIAAELFAARGFANVTVDEIGDAAGVSGPALYHHFSGKEALLGEMLIDISEYLLDGGRAVVAAGGDDVLERLVRFHAEFAVHDRVADHGPLPRPGARHRRRPAARAPAAVALRPAVGRGAAPPATGARRPHRAGRRARHVRADQLDAVQRPAGGGRHGRPAERDGARSARRACDRRGRRSLARRPNLAACRRCTSIGR